MPPVMSVVVAAYNAEETLAEQLDALAAQEVEVPWEVVVCDNRSTDGTAAMARSYAGRLDIRVVPATERASGAYARQVGVATTSSEWLAFVDADDVVAPGWLAAVVRGLREHRFVAGRLEAALLNSPAVIRSRPLSQDTGLQQEASLGPCLPHAGGGNLGIHRAVYEQVGGFTDDIPGLPDVDFCWRVQLAGVPLVFLPDAVLHVRLRATGRGLWSQGRAYGTARAMLERRYGTLTRDDVPAAVREQLPRLHAVDRPARRSGAVFQQVRQLTDPPRFLWQLAWHVGYRRERNAGHPSPAPA